MINASRLERVLNELRDNMVREPTESVEAFMLKTWRLALEVVESDAPPLERVREQHEQSDRLLAAQQKYGGAPGQDSAESEDE